MSLLWSILRTRVEYTFLKFYNENFNKILVVKIFFFGIYDFFVGGRKNAKKN